MHPSRLQSFFRPPMPFHPEELHKHVKSLERAYEVLPAGDLNAQIAVAKAIAAAVGAFTEGSLLEQGNVRPPPQWEARKGRGLWPQWKCLRAGFPATTWDVDEAEFKRLKNLRNDVDHGNIVDRARLILDRPSAHREAALQVLAGVYDALGSRRPAWWD